jgi:hypothetical protein
MIIIMIIIIKIIIILVIIIIIDKPQFPAGVRTKSRRARDLPRAVGRAWQAIASSARTRWRWPMPTPLSG